MKKRSIILNNLILLSITFFLFSCKNEPTEPQLILEENYEIEDMEYGTVTDIDGNVYKTVIIDTQEWMAENLKVTRFRDGRSISNYWAYNNDNSNIQTYGRLYSWNELSYYNNLVDGWHIPTNEEWEKLALYISEDNGGYSKNQDGNWNDVGGHMNSTSGWSYGNGGTDDYGFNALPSGFLDTNFNEFMGMGEVAIFWSATAENDHFGWSYNMNDDSEFCSKYEFKTYGFSVRLVKD